MSLAISRINADSYRIQDHGPAQLVTCAINVRPGKVKSYDAASS